MLVVSLVIAGVVSWYASEHPDGLERVAEDHEFIANAEDPSMEIMPDYTMPGMKGRLSTSLAGMIGVLATFGTVVLAGRIVRRKHRGES